MITIHNCDVMEGLSRLADESVQCVVTSPPYWGLRDYGAAGQIGLEKTFGEYLEKMRGIFAKVRRVLRKDGTLWLNMGDAYASSGCGGDTGKTTLLGSIDSQEESKAAAKARGISRLSHGLKPKDLIGQPWRVAFALQEDGWYLRSDIIWAKPNPMPESCRDRPTKSHEYIFLLSKSQRYFFDQEAVREEAQPQSIARVEQTNFANQAGGPKDYANGTNPNRSMRRTLENFARDPSGRNIRTVWTIPTQPFPEAHFATFPEDLPRRCIRAGTSEGGCCTKCGAPYRRLIEKTEADLEHQKACGGNSAGKYQRTDKQSGHGRRHAGFNERWAAKQAADYEAAKAQDPSEVKARVLEGMRKRRTLGWEATCACHAAEASPSGALRTGGPVAPSGEASARRPCLVLDPFGGSGTTGQVALELGCDAVLIELSPVYAALAKRRIEKAAPLLNKVTIKESAA